MLQHIVYIKKKKKFLWDFPIKIFPGEIRSKFPKFSLQNNKNLPEKNVFVALSTVTNMLMLLLLLLVMMNDVCFF